MKKFNKIGITIISFLSYFYIGSLVVVTGIIMNQIAKYFHYSISEISNIFTFLNFGILIGIIINYWSIKKIKIKQQITISFILNIFSLIILYYCKNIIIFSFIIFIFGVISGMIMSIGTFLITNLYKKYQRNSMLLITDSFFSIAGIIFPLIYTFLLKKNYSWYYIYIIINIIYIKIFILSNFIKFPIYKKQKNKKKKIKINKNIILLFFSALLYILGQLSFISWIPSYITNNLNLNILQASKIISLFWTSYMIGMWFFSLIIKKIEIKKLISILLFISTILIFLFNNIKNYQLLKIIIIKLGFFSSAIYTSLITLISLETKKPSPKLINLMLLFGTIGTLLTFIISSPIVKKYGIHNSLIFSNIIYFIVFNLILLLIYFKKK
ncbi:MFS transporter TsgA [Buchnera aphidicola]|uniref:MFS transporter TsgA n=1 Tax=Buchnera aphidicola TaxID=9 RepID=UPI0031B8817F